MSAHLDWSVGRSTRCCAATGRTLMEGEVCYSALREENERFVRQDYCEEAWPDLPHDRFFSYWKTRIPEAGDAGRRRLVFDVEVFHRFYLDLAAAAEPSKVLFRGVLALMLVRKRVLRLDGVVKRAGGDGEGGGGEVELLRIFDRRQDKTEEIPVPAGTQEEIAAVERELLELLEA